MGKAVFGQCRYLVREIEMLFKKLSASRPLCTVGYFLSFCAVKHLFLLMLSKPFKLLKSLVKSLLSLLISNCLLQFSCVCSRRLQFSFSSFISKVWKSGSRCGGSSFVPFLECLIVYNFLKMRFPCLNRAFEFGSKSGFICQ